MATSEDFSNSDGLIGEPLDTLEIKANSKNGLQSKVPALHIGFMEPRQYMYFRPPPVVENDACQEGFTAEEEEWLESMVFLEDDLLWILKLPHHRFWSQMLFDEELHKCLESYLSQSPRDFDIGNLHIIDEVSCSLKKIHKLVFLVYLRMSTYKESKMHHIRPEAFGEMIYENFLFDVPKLMDLCVLYGLQNYGLLSKMVDNIFSNQPKYMEDLNQTSQIILMAFNSIEEKLSANIPDKPGATYNPQESGFPVRREYSLSTFHDIVNYVTDVSTTIHAFLEIYPPACQVFHQNGAAIRISTFYEQAIPIIEKEIQKRSKQNESESKIEDIKKKAILSKTLLIKIFRNILSYCCIQHVLNSKFSRQETKGSESMHSESFLEIFTEIAAEKTFLRDYNLIYPFETDLDLFNQMDIKLDNERVSYIFSSIHDSDEVPEKFTSSVVNGARPKTKKNKSHVSVQNMQGVAAVLRGEVPSNETEGDNPASEQTWKPDDLTINSLIHSVLDLMGTLGEGFIEKCLQHFAYDSEKVIDSLLKHQLPDHLLNMDRNLKREFCAEEKQMPNNYSVLTERKNVFDNDEFDVFNNANVNMNNVHIGKKNKTPSTYENLAKDNASSFLKERILAYEPEESQLDPYDDEYDDTYDSMMVGLKEPALEGIPDKEEPPEDRKNEESEPEGNTSNDRRPLDFCVNPEILRERAAQRRESKAAARGGRRGGPPPDQTNSRLQKDRHKGNVANHSRRKQSDFKKSRGMMPI